MKKQITKTISSKITRAFVGLALACSLIAGLSGIIGIAITNQFSDNVYSNNVKPLPNAFKMEQDFVTMRMNVKNMILYSSYDTGVAQQNQTLYKDMMNQLNAVMSSATTEEERANCASIKQQTAEFKFFLDNTTQEINRNQLNFATADIKAYDMKAEKLEYAISRQFELSAGEADKSNQSSDLVEYAVIAGMALIIAAFIIAAIFIGRRIASKISLPINRLVDTAKELARGNLDTELDIQTDDETSLLAKAFNTIVESLRRLEFDVNDLISSAARGDLEERADIGRHEGKYRQIIEGANRMLDAVKQPLDTASDFILNLADGAHQEPAENIYGGYYAILIDNLNHVQESINILEGESQKLVTAGENGELDVRGDASRLKGIYAQIISGVNFTFDSIKAPLDAASVFVSDLAKGANQANLENRYKGYYSVLVDNLNAVNHSIATLLEEAEKLARAGKEGDLSIRGDEERVKGSYSRIIHGINRMMDSIVAPLEESAVVLDNFAYNDYTVKMTGTYSGAYLALAESINLVRDRFLSVQDGIIRIGEGDPSRLEEARRVGKRSENDRLVPAILRAYESIQNLIDESNKLAAAAYDGQLDVRGNVEAFTGGYRQIIEGMNETMEAVSKPIEESSAVLQMVAQGDLTVAMTGEYKGSYNLIKDGVNTVIRSLNELLSSITIAAEQVSVGSKQVSYSSQQLSQGATEQASSIEELTSSITEISAQTRQNAIDATQASTLAGTTANEASQGNEKMNQMLLSMQEINNSSANISKINKAIDDIAFQTNILALNAAVEAARAGQYGKGFAVVAEEVRNLAAKSADAAKEATALIESSIGKVEQGTKIANETANSLTKIADSIQKVTTLVGSIASASNEQASTIAQVDQGLLQVSSVVQTNSATAEESAASSEELNGQADTLKQMVGRFKLKSGGSTKHPTAGKYIITESKVIQNIPAIDLTEDYGKY